jgi:hypothetical protein
LQLSVYLLMLTNKYLKRLVRTYSQAEVDERRILEAIEKAATMIPEKIGITQENIEKAARVLEDAIRSSNINVDRMSDEQLMRLVLNTLLRFVPPEYRIHNIKEYDVAAQALAVELADDTFRHSAYRDSHNNKNRAFASTNTRSKIIHSVLLGASYIASLQMGKVKAADLVHNMAANSKNTTEIVQQVIAKDIAPKDSILKYRKSVTPDNPIMEKMMPVLNIIKNYSGPHLDKIYANFVVSDALTMLPAQDTLDPSTRIALRLYRSANIIYNVLLNREKMPFRDLLENQRTSLAARHIVFAAIAYNVLGQLDYKAHGLNLRQIEKLKVDLRTGNYEVELKNHSNFHIVIKEQIDDMYLEVELVPDKIEMMGKDYAESELKQSKYYQDLIHNLRAYKCTIAPVEGSTLFNIYVVLPVSQGKESTSSVHEVVFKIQSSLDVKVRSHAQGSSGSSVVQHANDVSRLRSKNARLFNRKKKYDWM